MRLLPSFSASEVSDQMLTLVMCLPCHFRNARLPDMFAHCDRQLDRPHTAVLNARQLPTIRQ